MALNFPSSPINGQQYSYNGKTWVYNATTSSWELQAAVGYLPLTGGTISGDLSFSGTGYVDLPAGTDGQRPGTPSPGMIRYNTTSGTFEGRDASSWRSFVENGDSSSVLNFTQSGTGAVTRTVDSKLKDAVSVKDFGAVGDGVADDTAALQAFFNHITANDVGTAYCSGNFRVSSAMMLGVGSVATKHIVGDLKISATAAIDTLLSINGFSQGIWDGEIQVVGTGSVNYVSRTCRTGIYITGSNRAKFGKLRAECFYQFGILVSSADGGTNNNLVDLGTVVVADCGSGYPGGSNLTSSWSNPVQSGTTSSALQTVTIDVTQLPPASVGPQVALIDGEAYFINSVDAVNSRIVLFPWINNALSSGTLQYVDGAGVLLKGADAGIININQLDCTRCSIGLCATSLYGPIIKRIVAQANLVGVAIGASPTSAMVTIQINGVYCELNTCDLLRITRADIGGYIASEYAFNFAKVLFTTDARSTLNVRNPIFRNTRSLLLNRFGTVREYRRDPSNTDESISTYSLRLCQDNAYPSSADRTVVLKRNSSWTINIQTPSVALHGCTGETATTLVLIGTGNNGAPTGTFTFNPPSGYTVNGGASAAFTGFIGPALFCIYWNVATNDFDVRCLNQVNQASATFNPPSIAAAGQATTTVTCMGAALGDYAIASFSLDLQGITLDAYVSAADTVTVVFRNGTGGAIDLASGTLRVRTFKP